MPLRGTCAKGATSTRRCRACRRCARRSRRSSALYGAAYDPDTEVTVTSGGTEGIFDAVAAVVHPGDEVIVFEPCYDSYVPAIEVNGGTAVVVPLRYPDYAVPWDDVRAAITPRTRMIMLNSPHNPTAAILEAADIARLEDLVDGTDITILSDEVYEHIIFDGVRHESMARYAILRDAASSSDPSARRIT